MSGGHILGASGPSVVIAENKALTFIICEHGGPVSQHGEMIVWTILLGDDVFQPALVADLTDNHI